MTTLDTPRAAWIGVTDAELPALRRAFRRELCVGLRQAFPEARVELLNGGARIEVKARGQRPVRLHEPNLFWSPEPEAERIARAIDWVRKELDGL